MKINMPVTNVEVPLKDDTLIVSKTDLKGQITYINKDFLDISGFTEAELIGQSHNIVRHPDMPVEAFEDFWRDMKAGRPWTGYVKNRCKNGDYYWVLATATPIRESGKMIGYLSVRRKASREAVSACEEAYRLFRENRAGGLQILHGKVVKGGEGLVSRMSLKARMTSGFSIMLATLALVAGIALWGISGEQEQVDRLYNNRLQPVQALALIGKLMADNRAQVLLALQHDPNGVYAKLHDHPLSFHVDAIDRNAAEITEQWKRYEAAVSTEEHKQLASVYFEARKRYVEDGLKPVRSALLEGRFGDANLLLLQKINPTYTEAAKRADDLYKYQIERGKAQLEAATAASASVRNWVLILFAVALVAGIVIAMRIIRSVTSPLSDINQTFAKLAEGDYTRNVEIGRDDELGKVLQGLQSMQIQQGFNVAEAKRVSDENLRIKIGLDCVSSPVRIADNAGVIIYANKACLQAVREMEEALRAYIPGFSADALVGSDVGVFYKEGREEALARLKTLSEMRRSEMLIGDRIYLVTTNPIVNDRNERLGTVGEWRDRTSEVAVEKEVAEIVGAAANGDFTKRVNPAGKDGFFLSLAGDLNRLLDTAQKGLDDVVAMLSAMADGDLTKSIDAEYGGTFGQLKDDANLTVARLREIVTQIKQATDAINTAAQEIAVGNQDLSSRTEEQASSLEETASSMEQLTGTVKQNADNARTANELASSAQEVAKKGGTVVA